MAPRQGSSPLTSQRCMTCRFRWFSLSFWEGVGAKMGCEWYLHAHSSGPAALSILLGNIT